MGDYPEYLTRKEAARHAGCHWQTFEKWAAVLGIERHLLQTRQQTWVYFSIGDCIRMAEWIKRIHPGVVPGEPRKCRPDGVKG